MNEEILLYHLDTGADVRNIHLRFEGDVLVLDGYDRGTVTKQLTDDFDYEYRITVAASELPLLYNRFGLQMEQRRVLLEAIAVEIGGAHCYTMFHKMLSAAGIAFNIWSG